MQVFYPFIVTLVICILLLSISLYDLFCEHFIWSIERGENYSILSFLRETSYIQVCLFMILIIFSIVKDKTHRKFVLITNNKFKKSQLIFTGSNQNITAINNSGDKNVSLLNNSNINEILEASSTNSNNIEQSYEPLTLEKEKNLNDTQLNDTIEMSAKHVKKVPFEADV